MLTPFQDKFPSIIPEHVDPSLEDFSHFLRSMLTPYSYLYIGFWFFSDQKMVTKRVHEEVTGGVARAEKNRFGGSGEISVF
jgi:hypothetical protein